ncbi:MAG: SRPBCC domain-containing protein [Myxococcota bacterium]
MTNTNLTQTYETFLRASPKQVWEALTGPEHTARYFFGTRISVEPRVGGRIAYTTPDGTLMVDGEVLKFTEGVELECTWRTHYDPSCAGEVSTVKWKLEPRGEATKLTTVHELEGAANTARNVADDGWAVVLSSMKTLVETGTPLMVGGKA